MKIEKSELKEKCPIWGTPAYCKEVTTAYYINVYSPRAGGWYQIAGWYRRADIPLKKDWNEDRALKAKLSWWIWRENRDRGLFDIPPKGNFPRENCLFITKEKFEEIKNSPSPRFDERTKNLALCIHHLTNGEIGKSLGQADRTSRVIAEPAAAETYVYKLYDVQGCHINLLCAASYCKDEGELAGLIGVMGRDGFLDRNDYGHIRLHLMSKGHKLVEEALHKYVESEQAFVAMSFSKNMNKVYENGLKKGIEDAGYKARRIDKEPHNNKIDDEIAYQIERSRFLVADLTDDNLGVYYEAGYAHGQKKKVICTMKKGEKEPHPDIRQYNRVEWEEDNLEEFVKKLSHHISVSIGPGPHKREEGGEG